MARRTRRLFRGGRVMDLAAGHGLLAHAMVLLDDSSPQALAIDAAVPDSARRLHEVLVDVWPRLRDRVSIVTSPIAQIPLAAEDVVVSSHACGALTDTILDRAMTARTRLALLPCCHDRETCDAGALGGWLDPALAIDVRRVARLEAHGYRVWTQTIPAAITPKNRLILAAPAPRDPVPGTRYP